DRKPFNRGGNQQGGNNNNRGGNNNNRGGNNNNRGGNNNRNKVMPVELTDEQVKNQSKETLEKRTNKGGKSKGAKHRREKRSFRREQDELQ
ncbi:hypothetical protein Q6296_27130, partial [Klebsiella variicola]|nr:hypothetical protein [Klebsiella variicola]